MNDLDVVPPHLAGVLVLRTIGADIMIRPTRHTIDFYDKAHPFPLDQAWWGGLSPETRRDLYQISLITTAEVDSSSGVAARVGDFVLYEDNEIRTRERIFK